MAETSVENMLLSVEQSAKALGITQRTLWRHAESGRAPRPVKLGGRRLWRRADLERFVDVGCDMDRFRAMSDD